MLSGIRETAVTSDGGEQQQQPQQLLRFRLESTTDGEIHSSRVSMLPTIYVAASGVNDVSLKQLLLQPSSTSATTTNGR